jgi:hypothetical protein
VSPSPDQEGGTASPPPTDPESTESAEGSRPPTASSGPTPLSEQLVMARGIPTALSRRLRLALESCSDLVLLAGVAQTAVRAAEPQPVTAARLELPEAASDLLGSGVETQVLADGERLRVWLATSNPIAPGSKVTLVAFNAGGELVETVATTERPNTTVELSLPWADAHLPEAVALVFTQPTH